MNIIENVNSVQSLMGNLTYIHIVNMCQVLREFFMGESGVIMSKSKTLRNERVSEKVFRQIKEAIFAGEFKAGEKLPSERELMETFQVSRGSVREAVRGLELKGFVVTRQGPSGGAFVENLSFDYVSDAFLDLFLAEKVTIPELVHVRQFVEPEVARLAAMNITEADRSRIIEVNDAEFLPISGLVDRIRRFQMVHICLAEICRNRFLEAILKSTMKLTWQIAKVVSTEPEVLHMPGEHIAIVEAVIDRDPESAKTMMKVHIYEFCNRLLRMEKSYLKKAKIKDDQSNSSG